MLVGKTDPTQVPVTHIGKWSPSDLQRLLNTRLITADHPEYEQARQVYNRWHDLHPGAIVRTRDIQELQKIIGFSAANGVEIAIRGGGHHIGGFGTSDGGIVVDLSMFRGVEIDLSKRLARADPGVRLGDMDLATCPRGLVVPTGTVSDTGIAGLTLGGGIGWLVGQYGLTCDHLMGADVLLANQQVVRAEDEEHKPLLWALRGGGGNFGIVLNFRYALQPLPPTYCGSLVIPWEHARETLVRIVDYLGDCPRSLTVAPTLLRVQDTLRLSVDFCCTAPDPERSLVPLIKAVGTAQMKNCGTWEFVKWQRYFDQQFLPPMRGYWKARYSRAISRETIFALCDAVEASPSSICSVLIEHLHGAYRDYTSEHAAFQNRDMSFGILLSARWERSADDREIVGWLKNTYDGVVAHASSSSYANYTMFDGPETTGQVTGAAFEALKRIKEIYDPGNIFRRNHNLLVTPKVSGSTSVERGPFSLDQFGSNSR